MFLEEYLSLYINKFRDIHFQIMPGTSVDFMRNCLEKLPNVSFDSECFFPISFFDEYNLKIKNFCDNPNIPLSFFEKNIEKLNWYKISFNPNIPFSLFEENLKRSINFIENLSDIPLSFIEKYPKFLNFGNNENLTFSFLEKNNIFPNINWEHLSENKIVPFSFFKKYIPQIKNRTLTEVNHFPFWFVKQYEIKFEKGIIFSHPQIEISYIEKNINKLIPKARDYLFRNENVPFSFLEKYLIERDFFSISSRSDLPISFCKENISRLNWLVISQNKNLPLSFLIKHLKKLNLDFLLYNHRVTTFFLEKCRKELNYDLKAWARYVYQFTFEYQIFMENKIHSFSQFRNDF